MRLNKLNETISSYLSHPHRHHGHSPFLRESREKLFASIYMHRHRKFFNRLLLVLLLCLLDMDFGEIKFIFVQRMMEYANKQNIE